MLTGGTSLVYFTNIRWGGGERLFACVIPARASRSSSARRSKRTARASRSRSARSAAARRRAHLERGREPLRARRQGLKDRGARHRHLGVEETMKFVWSDGIAAAAPQLKIVSGTPITAGCRMIKDAHELELMRLASPRR